MIKLVRTDQANPDFRALVNLLDAELKVRDGDDHAFYAQFNKTVNIRHVVVAYCEDEAAGSGAFREFGDGSVEIKRMFVKPGFRGQGIAASILAELERWSAELGFSACVLETGQNQPEAIALYKKSGYLPIPNYGPYAGVYNSVCMKKELASGSDK